MAEEYIALYRRFRPTKFSEILGQEHITRTLRNQVIANRVGHAYLFTGPRGCGKTSSAKVLARAVNCLNPKDGEPCNECEICKQALDGSLTDIVELDAASNNGVDDIRGIRDEVNFLPTTAKYRVYIIDEVHMLSIGAFNALLKTLEEPPKYMVIILIVSNESKMLQTIKSRCVKINFKKLSDNEIKKILTNADAETLTMLDGSMANIENLDKRREEYEQLKNLISDLKNCSMAEIFNKADLLYNKKDDIMELLNLTNIILFDERLYDGCEIVEKTKVKIDNNNNYTMCIDYLLMNLYDIINKTR